MEGKGWFVIYGLLFLVVLFLLFSQLSANAEIDRLKAEVAALRQSPPPAAAPDIPAPEPSASPDLSTAANRDARRKADLASIKEALVKYQEEKKSYPASLQELTTQFLEAIPEDPLMPKYSYRYSKAGAGFRLTAFLETKGDPDDLVGDPRKDQIYTLTEK